MFQQKMYKLIIFDIMMQQVIFQSTFLTRGFNSLPKEVLFFERCRKRFLKAIVFLNKKGVTFFLNFENQHFHFRNVGFLLSGKSNSISKYLRQ